MSNSMTPQQMQCVYGAAAGGITAMAIGVPVVSKEMAFYLAAGYAVPYLYQQGGMSYMSEQLVPALSIVSTYILAKYTPIGLSLRAM